MCGLSVGDTIIMLGGQSAAVQSSISVTQLLINPFRDYSEATLYHRGIMLVITWIVVGGNLNRQGNQ